MDVFFLRHGTRDFITGDVPLNDIGLRQAQALADTLEFQDVQCLLSSPKKRAQMTLKPLAEKRRLPIKTIAELDQMKPSESEQEFVNRVQNLINEIQQKKWSAPLLLCSHSDWLSTAIRLIPSDDPELNYQPFSCAQAMHFKIADGLWHVKSTRV